MSEILDISPVVSPRIAVFPGDVPFSRPVSMSFEAGDHLGLSSMNTTLHLGAHADAPNHYHRDGADMASQDLAPFLGPCRVVEVDLPPGSRILPGHLGDTPIDRPRMLFATGSFPDPDSWRDDFVALSPELIEHLADRGVRLVGIDTPSVDPAASKALESHQALHARDVRNLEGLVLAHVEPGTYTLVALPLRLEGADASPVRAVLLPDEAA